MLKNTIVKTFYKKTIPYIWGYHNFCLLLKTLFPSSAYNWINRIPVKPGLIINVKSSVGSILLTSPERCSIAKKFFWTNGLIQPKEDEVAIECFIKLSQKSKFILDIGSNSGIFSLISAKANPDAKVFSYDILPEAFKILKDNIIVNNLLDRVMPLLIGVGKNSIFHSPMTNITSEMPTSLKLDQDYKGNNSIEVEIKNLDDIFSELCINDQTCIKIDVEGFEGDIFENAKFVLENHRPYFLCEVLTTTTNHSNYNNLLSNYNYKKFLITDEGIEEHENINPNIKFKDWLFIPKEKSENILDYLFKYRKLIRL